VQEPCGPSTISSRDAAGRCSVSQPLKEGAKRASPDFYLALVGMIASLAFGYLLASLAPGRLFGVSADALYWLQGTAILQAIVLTWHEYATGTACFVWPTDHFDSTIPFLFGLSLFACITLMQQEMVAAWFYSMAAFAGVTGLAYRNQCVKARRETENRDALRSLGRFYPMASLSVLVGLVFSIGSALAVTAYAGVGQLGIALAAALNVLFLTHAVMTHVLRSKAKDIPRQQRGG